MIRDSPARLAPISTPTGIPSIFVMVSDMSLMPPPGTIMKPLIREIPTAPSFNLPLSGDRARSMNSAQSARCWEMFSPGMSCVKMTVTFSVIWDQLYLADEAFVTYSLLGKLCWVESDFLFTRVDNMCDLQIQHEVQLK